MKFTIIFLACISCYMSSYSQTGLLNKAKSATGAVVKGGNSGLTNEEVVKGLKEALTIGTNNSVAVASVTDGFNKNPAIYIPWPAEAQAMKDKLIQLGFQAKVTEFETSLNRAAEEAAKSAAPIFVDAVTGMSVGDGFAILKGQDTSAAHYLREKTYTPLKEKFLPVVKTAIEKVNVTAYWTSLVRKKPKSGIMQEHR